jgi:hypothetical protein
VVYAWHPLQGREVVVLGRGAGGVVRCVAVGDPMERTVSIPAWMLDRASCTRIRAEVEPRVSMEGLEGLRRLLVESRALDAESSQMEVTAHEQAQAQTCRSNVPTATRAAPSRVEHPSAKVPRRDRDADGGDSQIRRASGPIRLIAHKTFSDNLLNYLRKDERAAHPWASESSRDCRSPRQAHVPARRGLICDPRLLFLSAHRIGQSLVGTGAVAIDRD